MHNRKKITVYFLITCIAFLQSCFLIKKPVKITSEPVKGKVDVYHFIISFDKLKTADTALLNSYTRESKLAYDWIFTQAKSNGQDLSFIEHWPLNKDTTLKKTFVFRLPSNSLTILAQDNHGFKKWVEGKTENESKRTALKNWEQNLFVYLANSVQDSSIKKMIYQSYEAKKSKIKGNTLFVVHLIKVKKKDKVLGFYNNRNSVFIGQNRYKTIAHESTHYLGAPDLYIHKFWLGKRRRIVKQDLDYDIMNSDPADNSNYASMSNYTAYTIGWTKTLDKRYKPLLKQNLMAKYVFKLFLRL